ncbi:protein ALP1-like [Ixodes scapularis]
MQAICDSDRKFLDVFLGHTGKTHDVQAFRRSFVLDDLPQICEGDKYHILGDAAYPLREYLLTQFRNYGKLVPDEVNYNLKLSQTRVRIENAFGLLKGRFRQLLYLEFWSVNKATQFILACCVLHNLCIDAGDTDIDGEEVKNASKGRKPGPGDA